MIVNLLSINFFFTNITFNHECINLIVISISIDYWFIISLLWVLAVWVFLLLLIRISFWAHIYMVWKHLSRELSVTIWASCWSLKTFLLNMFRIFCELNSFITKLALYHHLFYHLVLIFYDKWWYLIIIILLTNQI